jgi:aspartyl-tRNA synthetase
MKRLLALSLLFAGVAMLTTPLSAHHGRGQSFDMKTRVTLKGTVSQVKWQNPHVLIFIDVKDESGKVVTWAFENSNVHTLATQGYNRNTLKVGQEVTAIVNPAANGTPVGIVVKVILADGKEIMSRERGNPVD